MYINGQHPAKQTRKIWRKNFKALLSNHVLHVGSFFSRTLYILFWGCLVGLYHFRRPPFDGFLRRGIRAGLYHPSCPTVENLVEDADDVIFRRVLYNDWNICRHSCTIYMSLVRNNFMTTD